MLEASGCRAPILGRRRCGCNALHPMGHAASAVQWTMPGRAARRHYSLTVVSLETPAKVANGGAHFCRAIEVELVSG